MLICLSVFKLAQQIKRWRKTGFREQFLEAGRYISEMCMKITKFDEMGLRWQSDYCALILCASKQRKTFLWTTNQKLKRMTWGAERKSLERR